MTRKENINTHHVALTFAATLIVIAIGAGLLQPEFWVKQKYENVQHLSGPAPKWQRNNLLTAQRGDAIQTGDGVVRLVVEPPFNGKLVLLGPDLVRSTQDIEKVAFTMHRMTRSNLVNYETECHFFVMQMISNQVAATTQ